MSKTEKRVSCYPDGQKMSEETYKDGRRHGLWTQWNKYGLNGVVMERRGM